MSGRTKGAPFSLFAFQDAITSVCGVVVLVTLLLALQLTQSVLVESRELENAETAKKLTTEIETLRRKIDYANAPNETTRFSAEAAGMTLEEIESRLKSTRKRLEDAALEQEENERRRRELDKREEETEALAAENKELEKKIQEAKDEEEKELENLNEANDVGVIYSFPNDGSVKPWFVDISGSRIVVVSRTSREEYRSASSFLTWAKSRPAAEEYFVLIARPSGIDALQQCKDGLIASGYQIGYDFIGENRELEFMPEEERGE